jgi:hypothetical protein
VVIAPAKAAWNLGMLAGALVFAPLTFSVGALLVFLVLTYATLLLGHSVGMHRRFIHRSYDCPKWLERTLVYLGTLVGMAGPFGILRIHDQRDWAQREPACHDFFSHRRSLLVDAWWRGILSIAGSSARGCCSSCRSRPCCISAAAWAGWCGA